MPIANRVVLFFLVLTLTQDQKSCNAGVIKDLYQRLTNKDNQTNDDVKQSAPICGSGIFSTPNEESLSPEIIFITNKSSKTVDSYEDERRSRNEKERGVNEVAKEFRFHADNVTLAELERNGFNSDAPVTFLMHGFTSGYPLQAWISAIIESYTIDRETRGRNRGDSELEHNLFVLNWHYAARGIVYPRAVANIPIVASYATRFINEKLIDEANIDPRRIQLIGHSLGAHLAGFIGKNTRSKVGRIYGLDPAGPCFGTISGGLYPSSKRLAPSDAEEVITIQTNTALLGIDKPLGKYSVFVEGGSVQPGCQGGGVLKSLQTLTFDGGDFDTVACSHSRAPNLLTYRHDQSDSGDNCQLIAYECKDWASFQAGHCGLCETDGGGNDDAYSSDDEERSSLANRKEKNSKSSLPIGQCKLIGLDWQYPKSSTNNKRRTYSSQTSTRRPYDDSHEYKNHTSDYQNHSSSYDRDSYSSTRMPKYYDSTTSHYDSGDSYNSRRDNYTRTSTRTPKYYESSSSNYNSRETYDNVRDDNTSRRPHQGTSWANNNTHKDHIVSKRLADVQNSSHHNSTRKTSTTEQPNLKDLEFRKKSESSDRQEESSRGNDKSVEAISMFIRTGDTQPYCAYHYQIVLELNEPFKGGKPSMSLLLQDSESRRGNNNQERQHSLSNDQFGNEFNEHIYTHLLTSNRKLGKVDHATLLFRDGLPDGHRLLKSLQVNYMSHTNRQIREKLSSKLCPVRKQIDSETIGHHSGNRDPRGENRIYFEPCGGHQDHSNQHH